MLRKFIFLVIFTVACSFLVSPVYAEKKLNVLVVYSKLNKNIESLLGALNKKSDQNTNVVINSIALESYLDSELTPDLIISSGTLATLNVLQSKPNVPVISVLIPKISFEQIIVKTKTSRMLVNHRLTAIFLDQPVDRQLRLVKALLPQVKDVGIILSEKTNGDLTLISKTIKKSSLTPQINILNSNKELISVLNNTLNSSDVLIPIIDPLVFNRTNAQTILLTAYRYKVPLIGISPSYLKAGAISAIYSTPEQIGTQLTSLIVDLNRDSRLLLPIPQYPKNFKVKINHQVARSFSASTLNEEKLLRKMR